MKYMKFFEDLDSTQIALLSKMTKIQSDNYSVVEKIFMSISGRFLVRKYRGNGFIDSINKFMKGNNLTSIRNPTLHCSMLDNDDKIDELLVNMKESLDTIIFNDFDRIAQIPKESVINFVNNNENIRCIFIVNEEYTETLPIDDLIYLNMTSHQLDVMKTINEGKDGTKFKEMYKNLFQKIMSSETNIFHLIMKPKWSSSSSSVSKNMRIVIDAISDITNKWDMISKYGSIGSIQDGKNSDVLIIELHYISSPHNIMDIKNYIKENKYNQKFILLTQPDSSSTLSRLTDFRTSDFLDSIGEENYTELDMSSDAQFNIMKDINQ